VIVVYFRTMPYSRELQGSILQGESIFTFRLFYNDKSTSMNNCGILILFLGLWSYWQLSLSVAAKIEERAFPQFAQT
jgi:hypothetical protein